MKSRNVWLFAIICIFLAHGALAGQTSIPETEHSKAAQEFTLGSGDVIGITVWNHEELSIEITVGLDGTISYPLLGQCNTTNLTPSGLEGKIRNALSRYMKDPQVSVNLVTSANSFAVVGEVIKPGHYELGTSRRIAEGIAKAGGITENALSNDITVMRSDNEVIHIDFDKIVSNAPDAPKVELKRGDLIIVPKLKFRVSILGGISKPGLYDITTPSAKLTDGIAMAGGITKGSKANRIGIVRNTGKTQVLLEADLKSIISNKSAQQNIQLQDGDIIYVPENNKLNFGDGLQTILSVASLANLLFR